MMVPSEYLINDYQTIIILLFSLLSMLNFELNLNYSLQNSHELTNVIYFQHW